jgi:hypothetical protein
MKVETVELVIWSDFGVIPPMFVVELPCHHVAVDFHFAVLVFHSSVVSILFFCTGLYFAQRLIFDDWHSVPKSALETPSTDLMSLIPTGAVILPLLFAISIQSY